MPLVNHALWFLTEKCNYHCPYCWQRDTLLEPTVNDPVQWAAAWNRLNCGIIDVTGGEPLSVPWLVECMSNIRPPTRFGFTTNLSYVIEGFIGLLGPARFAQITASWHPTQRVSLDIFTGKCLLLKNRGYNVVVNFCGWPEQLWMTQTYKDHFTSRNIPFHYDPCSPNATNQKLPMTAEELKYERQFVQADRAPSEWSRKHGNSYHVACDAGSKHVCVQPDGALYACLTDFVDGLPALGSIFSDPPPLLTTTRPCDHHSRCAGCDRDHIHPTLR